MKKWTVFVIAALLGLLLGFEYLIKKNEAKQAGQIALPQPGEPVGVSLPPPLGGTSYAQNYSQVTPASRAVAAPGAFTLGEEASRGVCNGGSLKDIMASHGKIWGYSAKGKVFKQSETENVYEALEKFFSCNAVAADDVTACQSLPDDVSDENKDSAYYIKPRDKCGMYAKMMLLVAYTTGKYGDISTCERLLAGLSSGPLQDAQPEDFCSNVVDGLGKVCNQLPAARLHKRECLRIFPGEKNDCGESQDCLDTYAVYMAIKTGNLSQCPAVYRASCEAFLSKSRAPCSDLAMQASKLYCSYLAKLKK